jgi:hypothetical protein
MKMKFPKEMKFYSFPQKIFFGLIETRSDLFKSKEQKLIERGLSK